MQNRRPASVVTYSPNVNWTLTKTLSKYYAGEWSSLKPEKLVGSNPELCTLRYFDKTPDGEYNPLKYRVVYLKMDQGRRMHIVSVIPHTHIKFLKNHPLMRNLRQLLENATEQSFREIPAAELFDGDKQSTNVKLVRTFAFNDNLSVLLCDEQQTIVDVAHGPVGVMGGAGTGKTTTIMYCLIQCAERGMKSLYACKTQKLRDNMQSNLMNSQVDPEILKNIELRTFDEIFPSRKKQPSKTEFDAWLKSYTKTMPKLAEKDESDRRKEILNKGVQLYQEFSALEGLNFVEYEKLGENGKGSLFLKNERKIVYTIWQKYKNLFQQSDNSASAATPANVRATSDIIYVDEAQNCSLQELIDLEGLTENSNIFYFYDPSQNINGVISVEYGLVQYFDSKNIKFSRHHLLNSFRCPDDINELCREVLSLRDKLFNFSYSTTNRVGRIIWCETEEEKQQQIELLNKENPIWRQSPQVMSVQHAPDKDIDVLLTVKPEEAGGLECDILLLIDILNSDDFIHLNKSLKRPQDDVNVILAAAIHKLYMLLSRTKNTVIFLHKRSHQTDYLANWLKEKITQINMKFQNKNYDYVSADIGEGSATDWQKTLKNLGENSEAAKRIKQFLATSETENKPLQIDNASANAQTTLVPTSSLSTSAIVMTQINLQKSAVSLKEEKFVAELASKYSSTNIKMVLNNKNCMKLLFRVEIDTADGKQSFVSNILSYNHFDIFQKELISHVKKLANKERIHFINQFNAELFGDPHSINECALVKISNNILKILSDIGLKKENTSFNEKISLAVQISKLRKFTEFLAEILFRNSFFMEKLNKDHMAKVLTYTDKSITFSPIMLAHMLSHESNSIYEEHAKFIGGIFKTFPGLYSKVTLNMLTPDFLPFSDHSLAIRLLVAKDTSEVLEKILIANPDFLESAELLAIFSKKATLGILCLHKEGVKILMKLIKENDQFVSELSIGDLSPTMKVCENGKDKVISILNRLNQHNVLKDIVLELQKKNNELATQLLMLAKDANFKWAASIPFLDSETQDSSQNKSQLSKR